MARFLSAFLLLILGNVAVAQSLEPVLVVKVKGEKARKSQKLPLSALHVETRILGFIAETKMTMTFENPHDRVLAGDLYFPLPEGSTVSGYALDVKGVLIDGVVVEKHKGRQVYEKIVRMGIDPGLVEWVKGNSFKTRVFPIPAKGRRTIAVKYISDLAGGKDGAVYRLPLGFRRKVKDFKLRVEVVKPSGVPKVTQGAPVDFEFKKWRTNYVAEVASKDASLDKDLAVAVPIGTRQKVLVERAPDGNVYFCINDFAPEHRREMKEMVPPTPRRIAVFWDASGSRGKMNHQKELDFLRAYFGQKRLSKGAVEVELVLFRNAAGRPERFVIRNGGVDGLVARLKAVRYDGGTQLGSLSAPVSEPPDFYLLFTDGISNFGLEEPKGLRAPVYTVSAGPGANHPF